MVPLCKKIPYFCEQVAENYREGQITELVYLNDNPVAFKLLIGWVYRDEIRTVPPRKNNSKRGLGETGQLLCLAALADFLNAGTLEDKAIDKLNELYQDYRDSEDYEIPSPAQLVDVYKQTERGSKLRLWVSRAMAGWISDCCLTNPIDEEDAP